jgi:hypothetical protein
MSNPQHYIFIDESGDPGKPFEIDENGNKIPTGASLFYILTAVCLDSQKLFALENGIMEIRNKFGFRSEIKSTIKGEFDNFNKYLLQRVNTKTIKRIKHITHVNSEYVNAMQLSDLVSGAIKDYFTGKNKDLRKIIDKKYLYKIY